MALTRLSLSRLEYDTGTTTVIATLPDGTTEKTLGGTPGGSDTQAQYNNAGAFAGMSGLVWNASAGKPQLGAGGIQWKNGASIGTMPWNPTAARTWTIPDATDTAVGQATTDTLTNKTLVAVSNTITDTGAAAGDVLVHNGTRFVKVTAGANGTFLGRSSGVTGFFTPAGGGGGTPGGSSGQLQWNSAGSFAGTSQWTTDGTGIVGTSSGYVQLGATSPATNGWIRFQAATANLLTVSASNLVAMAQGSGILYVGLDSADANAFTGLVLGASTQVNINLGATTHLSAASSGILNILPGGVQAVHYTSTPGAFNDAFRLGNNAPYASEGLTAPISGSGTTTLTAVQYTRNAIWIVGSGTFVFPLPSGPDDRTAYMKDVINLSSSGAITLSVGTGTTASLPIGSGRFLFANDTGQVGVFKIG